MAGTDLTDIQAAESVKLIGSNSMGVETTPVGATAAGDLKTADLLNDGGTQGPLTVGTSAVEAKVGVSVFSGRKILTVHNTSSNTIYWGYNNTVTTANGIPIVKNQQVNWDISDQTNAKVFLIAGSVGNTVRIAESA